MRTPAPSGLDWSKSTPTSLFYLPCQAQSPNKSLFVELSEPPRRFLSPSRWLETMPIQAEEVLEVSPTNSPGPVNDKG